MLLYPISIDPPSCMNNSDNDDVHLSAAWLHQVATNESQQDGRVSLPALQQLQLVANRHRIDAVLNTDATVASKSSLAFILGGADEDHFVDLAVGSGAPRDESATENRAANVPMPAAPKAAVKKSRICKFENCTRYVVNRGLCIGHGGGKRCAVVGCTSSAKNLGVCWKHGGSTKCTVEGCENRAKSRGVCWSHGGGRKCSEENCAKTAVSHGLCWAHGGGKRCVVEGCRKPAYERNGNVCSLHQATNNGALPKPMIR